MIRSAPENFISDSASFGVTAIFGHFFMLSAASRTL